MKFILSLISLMLILPLAAVAGIDPLDMSFAESAYTGPETVSLMVVPDGSGTPFTAAWLPSAVAVDATITLYLRDLMDQPVAGFPSEDMWLESIDGGMVPCRGGTIADAGTDAAGTTTWTAPLRAGGASESLCQVVVNGMALMSSAGFAITFNSPDLNADGIVNLSDLPSFVNDYMGGVYVYRSDFNYDQVINLSDVVKMAEAISRSCP